MNLLQVFDNLDAMAMNLTKPLLISEDKVRLVIYFLTCVPLSLLFAQIRNTKVRIAYNIFFGILFTLFLAREWFIFVNVTVLAIYLISRIPQKYTLQTVAIMSFLALSYVHIFRQWFDYLSWKLDFSVIQMTITSRLVYYAVDVVSGKSVNTSFPIFYSYIFMFPCIMIGPVPYDSYLNLIYRQKDYQNIKYNNKKAMIELFKALLLCIGEIWVRPYFDYDWYESEKWSNLSLWEKNVVQAIIGFVARFRYFAGFKFTQASMDAIGISYNNETDQLDRYQTCDYSYEIEKNCIFKTVKWNSTYQVWLKYCFFDRFQDNFSISTSYYLTYLISAVWHGFYLGYYQTFFWWALINQNCKYVFRARDKFQKIPPLVRDVIAWLYCTFTMNQIAMTMALLDLDKGLRFNNDMYWSGQIAILAVFFFFFITQFGQKTRK